MLHIPSLEPLLQAAVKIPLLGSSEDGEEGEKSQKPTLLHSFILYVVW